MRKSKPLSYNIPSPARFSSLSSHQLLLLEYHNIESSVTNKMPEVIVDYKPLWLVLLVSSNTLLLSSLLAVLLLAHFFHLNSSLGAQSNPRCWPASKMDELLRNEYLDQLKAKIKHNDVPEAAILPIFNLVRLAILQPPRSQLMGR